MASNKTEIANAVFFKLGLDDVSDVENDSNKRSRYFRRRYQRTKEWILAENAWNDSVHRSEWLAKDAGYEKFGEQNAFLLPTDFLRVLRMNDKEMRYRREGKHIITEWEQVAMLYVRDIDEARIHAPLFEALSAKLAFDLAPSLTDITASERNGLLVEYKDAVDLAATVDSGEGLFDDRVGENMWIDSRFVDSYDYPI